MVTNCIHPVGHLIGPNGKKIWIPCKLWRCPYCGRINRWKLMEKLKTYFAPGTHLRFMTLTVRRGNDVDIMKAWHKLYLAIKKHVKGFQYFGVKEFQRNGTRHLHILINAYLPWDWVVERWQACIGDQGGVYLQDSKRKITDTYTAQYDQIRNVSAYMTKYMTKSLDGHYKSRERRYFYGGAKMPVLNPEWTPEDDMSLYEFKLDGGYNIESKRWHDLFYNPMQQKYGPAFMEYMAFATMDMAQAQSVLSHSVYKMRFDKGGVYEWYDEDTGRYVPVSFKPTGRTPTGSLDFNEEPYEPITTRKRKSSDL